VTSYLKEEMVTATDAVRNFSSVLKRIRDKEIEKVVIVKNNKFEAVMINVEEYEKMKDAYEVLKNIYSKTKKT
jgi:prevent-host-death family protein